MKEVEIQELEEQEVNSLDLDDEKKEERFLSAITWNELTKVNNQFVASLVGNTLNVENAEGYRTAARSVLDARLESLASQDKKRSSEYRECAFLSDSLKKGWIVTDIDMLSQAYEMVYKLPDCPERKRGMVLMKELTLNPSDTIELREQYLNLIREYFDDLKELLEPEGIDQVIRVIDKAIELKPGQAAYPKEGVYRNVEKRNINKQDYVLEEMTDEELEEYKLHEGRTLNGITKSNRQAIKEVMGEEVYDDIDEMHIGDVDERRIVIHHAQGNKWMKSGADVLELNFLGSGITDEWREHKYKDGFIDTDDKTEDEINEEYGVKAKDKNGNDYSYIRYKDKHFQDSEHNTFDKRKYIIGGATPGFFGALNLGENSIENVRNYGQDFAADFLKPHFDNWLAEEEVPHDIHISLTGWSRGAVAAGQAIKKIDEWIKKYKQENPAIQEYLNHVKIDAFLKDPVPGAITSFHLSTCNLRNVPNLNATVYCTMANDHYDLFYPFQHVKGAKKIIISTERHELDFERVDYSQQTRFEDGKKHQSGFYDAETGEYFRGTGVSQLQDGVFICDDQHNLVRLSSYSQLGKLTKAIFDKGGIQRTRKNNIHKMVRDWFVENTLEMGFADEETRNAEKEKNANIEERILASPNKRIAPVQSEIRKLRELMQKHPSKKEIVRQNNQLIKVCRAYMKKTSIPASGDSEYRVNLVSDLLSFTMKETNQLKTEIKREKNPEYISELDEKIKARKERIAAKEDALERKLAKEETRLEKEKLINKHIKEITKLCKNYLKDLKKRDKNRIGVSSDDYDAMIAALDRGSRLGPKTSVNGFIEVLRGISKATDKYVEVHKGIFHGPFSDDGKFRQNTAKFFSGFSKKIGRKTEELSIYLPDKEMPLAENIKHREAEIKTLREKVNVKAMNRNANVRNGNPEAVGKKQPGPVKGR
ncbi:MAG: hypothetical protein K6G03_12720 [Lachnospiraceae bacterium]|nr:hypothetical protein [Lachnospiraceae bacterium]